MGWTFHYGRPRDEKQEILKLLTWPDDLPYTAEVLKLRKVGSIWFVAVRFSPKDGATLPDSIKSGYTPDENGAVTACIVILTKVDRGDWGYKDMSEDMGPAEPYCRCPNSILKLLSPTSAPYALNFRERSRKWNSRPRLKIGDRIRIPEPAPGWGTEFKKIRFGNYRNVFKRSDGTIVRLRPMDLYDVEVIS